MNRASLRNMTADAAAEPSVQEVHLWPADLAPPAGQLEALEGLLSPDELARVRRFKFDIHRKRFIAAHGFLRSVLAAYLKTPPQAVSFQYGPHGKPELAPDCSAGELRFNLAHSENLALLAVARRRAVGVDVEHLHELTDLERMARKIFAEVELSAFYAARPADRPEIFFRFWTRKEALVKALGGGLSLPLHEYALADPPTALGEKPLMFRDPRTAQLWCLWDLPPAAGYQAAVAVEGAAAHIQLRTKWSWN